MQGTRVLAIFDFDKTLVKIDSFRRFSYIASNNVWEMGLVFLGAMLGKGKFISNSKYKEFILKKVWIDRNEIEKKEIIRKLIADLNELKINSVFTRLDNHERSGHKTAIISAAPIFYLETIKNCWFGNTEVFGTEMICGSNGLKLINLHGDQKAECVRQLIKRESPELIWVYTDHPSDIPIIMLADRVTLVNPNPKLRNLMSKNNKRYDVITW